MAAGGSISGIFNLAAAGITASGQESAASTLRAGYNDYINQLKQFGADQQALSFENWVQQRQPYQQFLGPEQLAAWQQLSRGLGINAPTGPAQNAFAPTTPSGTPSIGGILLTPTAGGTPSSGVTPGGLGFTTTGALQLPGTGTLLNAPGYNISDVMGPINPAGISQPIAEGQFLTGPTSAQIQSQLSPELDFIMKYGSDALKAQALQAGTFGGGGFGTSLMDYLRETGMASGWEPAYNRALQNQVNAQGLLLSLATGTPAAVNAGQGLAAGASNTLTSQMGTMGTNIASGYPAMAAAGAQGTLGATNAWSRGATDIGRILTQYAQSQPSGVGFNSPSYGWGTDAYNQNWGLSPSGEATSVTF